MINKHLQQPAWIIWHPHQHLWNRRLVKGLELLPGPGRRLAALVVLVDSLLLWARVVTRRVGRLGLGQLVGRRSLPPRVLYVDCGVHKQGLQIRYMHSWFGARTKLEMVGFEASGEHFDAALVNLGDVPDVDLRQQALVSPEHTEPTVRLYKNGGDGKGDSLFSERGTAHEDVPAVRLSQVIRDHRAAHGPVPVLIRMNIEGAELYVVQDLVDAGLVPTVSGFYGMWDDLSKIDVRQDAAFRALLRDQGIRNVTFNDRDLGHPLRARAIRYDITTSLLAPQPV